MRPVWNARQPSSQPSATASSLHVPGDLGQARRAIRCSRPPARARRRAARRSSTPSAKDSSTAARAISSASSPGAHASTSRITRRPAATARAGPRASVRDARSCARPRARGSSRRRLRCSSSSARGTCTFAIRRRSPREPPRRRGMPWPLSTITVPGCRPGLDLDLLLAVERLDRAGRAEHGLREPQVEVADEIEAVALEALVRAARARARRDRRPARRARRRARARSGARAWPSSMPAGMSTPSLRRCGRRPRPRQSGHGFSGMRAAAAALAARHRAHELAERRAHDLPHLAGAVALAAGVHRGAGRRAVALADLAGGRRAPGRGRSGRRCAASARSISTAVCASAPASGPVAPPKPPPKSEPSRSSRKPMSMKRSVWKP